MTTADLGAWYLNNIWSWGSQTAWNCLPEDLDLGKAVLLLSEGVPAVGCHYQDEDRVYLYKWCMRSEAVS